MSIYFLFEQLQNVPDILRAVGTFVLCRGGENFAQFRQDGNDYTHDCVPLTVAQLKHGINIHRRCYFSLAIPKARVWSLVKLRAKRGKRKSKV